MNNPCFKLYYLRLNLSEPDDIILVDLFNLINQASINASKHLDFPLSSFHQLTRFPPHNRVCPFLSLRGISSGQWHFNRNYFCFLQQDRTLCFRLWSAERHTEELFINWTLLLPVWECSNTCRLKVNTDWGEVQHIHLFKPTTQETPSAHRLLHVPLCVTSHLYHLSSPEAKLTFSNDPPAVDRGQGYKCIKKKI